MAKVLTCSSILPDCEFEVHAASQEEVLQMVALHAKVAHHIEEIDEATAEVVVAAIRDE